MSAVAEYKGIGLKDFSVDVDRNTWQSGGSHSTFTIEVKLPGGLTARERTLLFNAARKCDVTKLLEGELSFTYQLVGEE